MEERIKLFDIKLDARRREEKIEIDDKKDGRKKDKWICYMIQKVIKKIGFVFLKFRFKSIKRIRLFFSWLSYWLASIYRKEVSITIFNTLIMDMLI